MGSFKSGLENACCYCLYFKRPPGAPHARSGNCALHKEWIESAARMTCSDMTDDRLQRGIYHVVKGESGDWRYLRRHTRVRTRLFLVSGGRGQRGKDHQSEVSHQS